MKRPESPVTLSVMLILSLALLVPAAWCQTWEGTGPDGGSFVGVVTDPADADQVIAVGDYPSPPNVYRSFDGGQNWTQTGTVPYSNPGALAAFDFTRFYVLAYNGCYSTTDGGASWAYGPFPSGSGYGYAICVHPTDPNLVYAAGYLYNSGNYSLVYFESTDGAQTWTSTILSTTYFIPYDMTISETDPDVMYICGYQQVASTYTAGMFKTTDGGATWADISASVETDNYRYLYTVEIDPTDSSRVYAGGTYFYRSVDGGTTWTRDTSNYMYAQDTGIDRANPANLYTVSSSGDVYVSNDYALTWTRYGDVFTGYGEYVEVAPAAPSTIFVASTYGGVYKSIDSGGTWNPAHSGIECSCISSLAAAPSKPNTVFADITSGYTLTATYDAGGNWQEITYPLGCSGTVIELMVNSNDENIIMALEAG